MTDLDQTAVPNDTAASPTIETTAVIAQRVLDGQGTIQDFLVLNQTLAFTQKQLSERFLECCGQGNIPLAQLLIKAGADPHFIMHVDANVSRNELLLPDRNQWTAAHFAAQTGQLETLKWLKSIGVDINKTSYERVWFKSTQARPRLYQRTPGDLALNSGNKDVMRYFFDENLLDPRTAAFAAIKGYNVSGFACACDELTAREIDLKTVRDEKGKSLSNVADKARNPRAIEELSQRQAYAPSGFFSWLRPRPAAKTAG